MENKLSFTLYILAICCFLSIGSVGVYAQSDCCNDVYGVDDYCDEDEKGIYFCISTLVPAEFACDLESCDIVGCHHIHLRNVTVTCNEQIKKIEITATKMTGSDDFMICHPLKQYGLNPWTSEWTVTEGVNSINTSQCISWNGAPSKVFTFTPPGTGYDIGTLNHWQVTICGASAYSIRYQLTDNSWCGSFTPSIGSGDCPPDPCF